MNLRVVFTFGLLALCTASSAFAADLPLMIEKSPVIHQKKIALPGKKTVSKPHLMAQIPAAVNLKPSFVAPKETNDLSWVLGPMVANADGGKREGSASATANIVVETPGANFGNEMVIELEGHVVKTSDATVRLDIHLGEMKKTVVWKADEIKAGIFKITLNEKVTAGTLPNLIPVSALAFVTQSGEGHAAMVSLEKIVLRFSKPQLVSTK
jgi:hypothetical protein